MFDNQRLRPTTGGRELLLAAGLSLFTTCCYLTVLTPIMFFEELSSPFIDHDYSISACRVIDSESLAVISYWAPGGRAEHPRRRFVATVDLQRDVLRTQSVQSSKERLTASAIPEKQIIAVNFSGNITHIPLGPRKAGSDLATLFEGLPLNDLQSISRRYAAALIGFELSVWDLEHQKRAWSLIGEEVACSVVVPARESVIALLSDGRVMEFDARTGNLIRNTAYFSSAIAAAVSRDGRRLAVLTRTDGVRILTLLKENGPWTDILPGSPGIPADGMHLSLSPNGELLIVSPDRDSRRLALWRVSTRQCLQTFEADGSVVQGASFCSDSAVLAWSRRAQLYRWDFRRGTKEVWTPREASQRPWNLSLLWPKSTPFARS